MTMESKKEKPELGEIFPVKKCPVLLAVGLSLISWNLYAFWWFFSRRKTLNGLSGLKLGIVGVILFLISIVLCFISSIGVSVFVDLANVHDSSEYFQLAQRLEITTKVVGLLVLIGLISLNFRVKAMLEKYQGKKDLFTTSFSGWATLFFGVPYLQYRINRFHASEKPKRSSTERFSGDWRCIAYASTAVFLSIFIGTGVLYWASPWVDVEAGFVYLIVLAVFAVKLITDRYEGQWNVFAKKAPAFLVIAFFLGVFCGGCAGNALRSEMQLSLSESQGLIVKTSSAAIDLIEFPRYQLGSTITYSPRIRMRDERLEWVVYVKGEWLKEKWVIDAETGVVLAPN